MFCGNSTPSNCNLTVNTFTAEEISTFQFGVAHFKVGPNRQLFIVPNLGNGGFNHLSQSGDVGIFFSDGLAGGAQNQDAGLVLGPWTGGWAKGIRIAANGKVGIGIAIPQADLDVDGDMHTEGNVHMEGDVQIGQKLAIGMPPSGNAASLHIQGDLKIADANGDNQFEVDQAGVVHCREVEVNTIPIPDYVFDSDYRLMPLSDLRTYIDENSHLPGIKSAKEYEEKGSIALTELSVKLLEKVEELTLYTLQLEEKIQKLEQQVQTTKP